MDEDSLQVHFLSATRVEIEHFTDFESNLIQLNDHHTWDATNAQNIALEHALHNVWNSRVHVGECLSINHSLSKPEFTDKHVHQKASQFAEHFDENILNCPKCLLALINISQSHLKCLFPFDPFKRTGMRVFYCASKKLDVHLTHSHRSCDSTQRSIFNPIYFVGIEITSSCQWERMPMMMAHRLRVGFWRKEKGRQ